MCLSAALVTGGSLDPDFGVAGTSTIDIGDRSDNVLSFLQLPDGSSLLFTANFDNTAGSFSSIVRLKPDGTLDPAYGQGGIARNVSGGGPVRVLESNGKILAAGQVAGPFFNEGDKDLSIGRFDIDGSPDPTFNNGQAVSLDLAHRNDAPTGIIEQSDGKILVVGFEQRMFLSMVPQTSHVAMVRLDATGQLDPGFGNGGTVITDLPGVDDEVAFGAAVQPDGKIVVAGSATSSTGSHHLVLRYNIDGTLDQTFSKGGIYISKKEGGASGVTVADNGNIVVVGQNGDFTAFILKPSGRLMGSFGRGGIASVGFEEAVGIDVSNDRVDQFFVMPDGRILLVGNASDRGLALARFTAKGRVDPTFGGNGIAYLPIDQSVSTTNAILEADGRILAAASSRDVILAKYHPKTVLASELRGRQLNVTGTDSDDTIIVTRATGTTSEDLIRVTRGDQVEDFPFAGVGKINIRAGAGNDAVSVAGVPIPAIIRGGAGNDTLTGSDVHSQIFGENGDDILAGGPKRDIISGGRGLDQAMTDSLDRVSGIGKDRDDSEFPLLRSAHASSED